MVSSKPVYRQAPQTTNWNKFSKKNFEIPIATTYIGTVHQHFDDADDNTMPHINFILCLCANRLLRIIPKIIAYAVSVHVFTQQIQSINGFFFIQSNVVCVCVLMTCHCVCT